MDVYMSLYARIDFMGERYKSFGFKGKRHSEETKNKIALTSKGRTHKMSEEGKRKLSEFRKGMTAWNKGKKYLAISGENHWNWQGGKTEESLAARTSLEYKLWRKEVYERDKYTCVLCGYTGNQLIADHIKSFSRYPELRFDIKNGRALCIPCHKTTPNYCGKVRVNKYA